MNRRKRESNPNWKGGNQIKECIVCGEEFLITRRKREEKRRFCSHQCRGKYFSGERNGNWKGSEGKNRDQNERQRIIEGDEYKEWRRAVVNRDSWKCVVCGCGENIVAHHILCYWDYPHLRFDLNNGITLCRSCHTNVHLNKVLFIESSEANTLDIVITMKIESELIRNYKRLNCEI